MDALTFSEALGLVNYWAKDPPAHVSIAALMRSMAGESGAPARQPDEHELRALADSMNQ